MVKKIQKSQKITFFQKIWNKKIKKNQLRKILFFILNIRNMGFDQSSQVQPNPEEKKNLKKSLFFKKSENLENILLKKEKKYYSLNFANWGD